MTRFPIGSYIRFTDATREKVCADFKVPAVFRVVKTSSEADREAGLIAFEPLSGPRAYKVVLKAASDQIEPHLPCYACKHAVPTNDRDVVRCGKLNREFVDSAHTCALWEARP